MNNKKWMKHLPLFIIEILVLIVAVLFLYVVLRTTGKNGIQKDNLDKEQIVVNEEVKEREAASLEIEAAESTENSESVKEYKSTKNYSGIYNIAFFGVDARDENLSKGNNRSDTIMLCSIDMDTHEVKLISIYRDTYLNIGNDTYNKCNSAYAKGGPEQALGMINMNTDLYVTDYITVGFEGLQKAIDAIGGVTIDVQENEIAHLNNYQISMVGESEDGTNFMATAGKDYIPVTSAGAQTLNGLQATAYCRIRYVGDDFARTERQRNVLIAMLEKAKGCSVSSLVEMMNGVLPNIVTSIDVEDMVNVLSMVGSFKVTVSDGFPFEGMRNGANLSVGSSIVPDSLDKNVIKLHQILYGEEDYEPSEDLKRFSAKIKEDTKERLLY